jgi:hypothetical protein
MCPPFLGDFLRQGAAQDLAPGAGERWKKGSTGSTVRLFFRIVHGFFTNLHGFSQMFMI